MILENFGVTPSKRGHLNALLAGDPGMRPALSGTMRDPLWNIVLAAGSGRRLASVTGGIPKQFWSADGGPSLLEDTLERTAPLVPPERTVIVVDRSHATFVRALPGVAHFGGMLYQPCDRGTAVGVMLGLIEVLAAAPDATMVLTPSDHGVARPEWFVSGIETAAADVASGRADVVLFGVAPVRPERDYGWITPAVAAQGTTGLRPVAAFVEKPTPDIAERLFGSGAVCNTMVLVARASALIDLYSRYLPDLLNVFSYALHLNRDGRREFLHAQYEHLSSADFSRDLIGRADNLLLHTWPAEMGWSDLGTPERLALWRGQDAAYRCVPRSTATMRAPQFAS